MAELAIGVRVDCGPRASIPKHAPSGVGIGKMLAGVMEYDGDSKPVILKAGPSLYIPAGAIHSPRNLRSGNAAGQATCFVKYGEPFLVLDK
ncbi:cupin domain-containing protein [Massilia sp. RP-1-19]|uniref:Cupin domain-containing protein n=1 Tax=Massilia polaris TaxID=2728846 RepID=A0A848HNF8_9BURK|nr:cupin domain-containing protein [Massilia polaris]